MEEVETFEDRISNSFLFALSTANGHTLLERDYYDQGETSNERKSTLEETSCRISQIYFCSDSFIVKNAKFYSRKNFRLYGILYGTFKLQTHWSINPWSVSGQSSAVVYVI